jgi:hypothetical protein
MIRLILVFGVVAGLIVAVAFFLVTTMTSWPPNAPVGYLSMIVALTAVFLGIKQYRDKVLGGVIRFGPAVLLGLGISAVASVVYALGWELTLAVSGLDFAQGYAKMTIEAAQARGASEAELQNVTADAESFRKMYANPLYRLPITFVEMFWVGVVVSLISAAVLRNSRILPARPRS